MASGARELLLGSVKAESQNILGPHYMIKHELTFASGVQESVLLDFLSQNLAYSQNLSK